jgi:hypothetical protein
MLRKFGLAIMMAFGLAGASLSASPAQAAVVQPGAGANIAQAVDAAPAAATKVWHYGRPHYRARYYRPYRYGPYRYGRYYRPYPYRYARPYGGCRIVARRVWTDYGYRVVRRRVCRY